MDNKDSELLEKIRQQFDFGPYPRVPLEKSPKETPNYLYIYNITTPYYLRNQKVIDSHNKIILDVGCGTGFTTLGLIVANPEAKIVGIDISEKSVELARQRLEYHNYKNVEFHVMSIDEISTLNLHFDYINCDEVLYLISSPAQALQLMRSVLKPEGIIRANLHSLYQRNYFFRAQKLFQIMGLMENNPEDMEMEIAVDVMKALKDNIYLKTRVWKPFYEKKGEREEALLSNHLLQGDRGYTISDMFALLEATNLEFIEMINGREWDLMSLFKNPDDLPVFLGLTLPEATRQEKLEMFELLNPVHRLLDFWCGHPEQGQAFTPVSEWTNEDWHNATVHLHPQLRTPQVQEKLSQCLRGNQVFPISQLLPIAGGGLIGADVTVAACLFPPLLESPQSVSALLQRWKQLKPLNLETFEPLTDDEALVSLKDTLTGFEDFGYLLLERAA
ncbi:MAG: class I SAM-dependent methyltransferase [Cyanobacteriota bacterium]|nr:class I SAM-dependent methyltransferase [Cyanobacteriota bacterium]